MESVEQLLGLQLHRVIAAPLELQQPPQHLLHNTHEDHVTMSMQRLDRGCGDDVRLLCMSS